MAGMLYLVPTPIGNLGDISARCRQTLEEADFIAAEDTRVSLKLLNHLGIKKSLVSYYEHNKASKCVRIATGIENDAVILTTSTLKGIDKLSLDIRLVVVDGNARITCAKSPEVILEALTSVYLGLAMPQKIEVRTVDNQNFHRTIV